MGNNQVRQRQNVERLPIRKILKNGTNKTSEHSGNVSVFNEVSNSLKLPEKSKPTPKTHVEANVLNLKPYKKFWILAGILGAGALIAAAFRPTQKAYVDNFVVTPANESKPDAKDKKYMDSLENKKNEMIKKTNVPHIGETDVNTSNNLNMGEDPLEAGVISAFRWIGNLFGTSSKKKEKVKKVENTKTEPFNTEYTAEERAQVVNDSINLNTPYLDYRNMTTKEIEDAGDKRLERPKYEPLKDPKKNVDKKDKTEQKKEAENPMVVKEKEVSSQEVKTEKTETKVQKTVVPKTVATETKTNTQLKPEIKEESKFVKKYVTDFIKRDLISKPANYTETINSFIKEFGYKPNNDEIAEYVIAKEGDCVSGILIKAKEKELGRNLTGKEIAAIGKLANNIQIRRKTEIKGATNDFIIAGDTIPTREVKMLFN